MGNLITARDDMAELLWSDKPVVFPQAIRESLHRGAVYWSKNVFPLGNGRLGCTVFGDPARERIQFNEDSLWIGNEDCTGAYQPFGDVYVDLPHGEFADYRRELDISRAVQTVTYTSKGVRYKREAFASHPAQVVVFRFSADKAASLSGKVFLGNLHELPATAEGDTLTLTGNTESFLYWQLHLEQPKRLLASREYASDEIIDLDFEAQVRVLNEGGSVKTVGDSIEFDKCDSLTLILAADTNYLNRRDKGWRTDDHPHAWVSAQLEAAARRPYAELLEEHVADYQRLYRRLDIDLGETPDAISELPTVRRVSKYREQFRKRGFADDRELETLIYQYARYLMISSSRPGEGALPANLQGVWLYELRPAWRCDYHTDVNVQMNYWFADQANLSECFVPLAEWIDSIREVRREETSRVLDVKRGWLMRSENGIFGGSTWHIQKGDSAWLCQNLWDHYAFTHDKEYLERYAYPIMREICQFWLDHLKECPDGTLVAPKGRSPEHGPVDVDGVSYDQQLCRNLFSNTIKASEALDADEPLRHELIAKCEKLLGPQIGNWGQLQEWMDDIDDPEDQHRHVSHMIAVHPGRQIHPVTTPEFAEAARVSMMARGKGPSGWSKVWRSAIFARLLAPELAYERLSDAILTKIHGNLWSTHPPFQIDCNFGYAAAVNEMLLQSHLEVSEDVIQAPEMDGRRGGAAQSTDTHDAPRAVRLLHLLPALPQAWADGSVRGMRARGGFDVDMVWRDRTLVRAEIKNVSGVGARCVVRYGDRQHEITLSAGQSWTMPGACEGAGVKQ